MPMREMEAIVTAAPTNVDNEMFSPLNQFQHSNEGQLAKIELYVLVTTLLLCLTVIQGLLRRRYGHHKTFRLFIWSVYTASYSLISYTMGLMTAVQFHNDLIGIWSVFLLILLGRVDSLTAYSLDHNERRSSYAMEMILQMFWSGWMIGHYVHRLILQLPLWGLWSISAMRIYEKISANEYASKTFGANRGVKLVADFMSYEHELDNEHYDPINMEGYHYLVYGEKVNKKRDETNYKLRVNMKKSITIDKVWRCNGCLFRQDPNRKLKDICLSFALFRLLLRRVARYPLHEAKLEKTKAFVRDGLIQMDREGYDARERVFRLIEVELAFLYDYFYTKYPTIFAGGFPVRKIFEILVVFLCSIAAIPIMWDHQKEGKSVKFTVFEVNIDVNVTRAMICIILFIELYEFIAGELFCDWNKVTLLCKYVETSSWQGSRVIEKIIKWFCQKTLTADRFGRKMRQYSFLHSFDHNPLTIILNPFLSKIIHLPKEGQQHKSIPFPMEATREVLNFISLSLGAQDQKFTNGARSLIRNSSRNGGCLDDQLVCQLVRLYCEIQTHTHGVMIWHIATCLCEHEYNRAHARNDNTLEKHFKVADCLSKYTAYLASHIPELLPDHVEVSRSVFKNTVKHARKILGKGKSLEEKFEKMMEGNLAAEEDGHENIMIRGAKLGRLLLQKVPDRKHLWKVLADLWVEKIVFLAPSDNPTAHVEYLAQGCECITVVWALLNHAGIVEPPDSPTANNPAEDIPIESDVEIKIERL